MAYYITISSYNKSTIDQEWAKIAHDTFDAGLEKEISNVGERLIAIDKNPRSVVDSKLLREAAELENKKWNLIWLKNDVVRLRDAMSESDLREIKSSIFEIDEKLYHFYTTVKLSEPLHPFHEFFSRLFQLSLKINIEKDYNDTLSLLPLDTWMQLFTKINSDLVIKAISEMENAFQTKEMQQYYFGILRDVRDVIKNCIETNAELLITDELYESNSKLGGRKKARVAEIFEKYFMR